MTSTPMPGEPHAYDRFPISEHLHASYISFRADPATVLFYRGSARVGVFHHLVVQGMCTYWSDVENMPHEVKSLYEAIVIAEHGLSTETEESNEKEIR